MQPYPLTIVWRHRRENLKKCSLRFLEQREDFRFFTYPCDTLPDLSGYILLDMDAPPLTSEQAGRGLFLIDATWRYATIMRRQLKQVPQMICCSLPTSLRTAYPRRQHDCTDPDRGLASVEALYAAYYLLGRDPSGLLDHFHWKTSFLEMNFNSSSRLP